MLNSAFTLLEAFDDVPPARRQISVVEWAAFPRSAQASNAQIDTNRFALQDEYVEWRVERTGGQVSAVTFTTDFLAYYEALARVGVEALVPAVQAVIPGASPTAAELFGPSFTPATASETARARRFVSNAQQNPWINGAKGILCLAHGSNTLGALFGLVNAAATPDVTVPAGAICGTLGGNCVPTRNSDPSIATAVQTLAQGGQSLSLADPVGIEIARLSGIWRIGANVIDINNLETNQGVWTLTRSGRRGQLKIVPSLFLDDKPVTSGAQVASVLRVQASVISAADSDLPDWARVGQEASQRLIDVATGGV